MLLIGERREGWSVDKGWRKKRPREMNMIDVLLAGRGNNIWKLERRRSRHGEGKGQGRGMGGGQPLG